MLLIFIALSAFADTIVLKGGKQIEGTVLERNMDEVKIDFKGVELIYSLNEIESINGEKVISLPAEPTTQIAPADVPAQVSPEEVAPAAPQEEKKLEPQAPEKKGWAPLLPLPGEVPAWLKGGPAKYGKDAKAFAAIAIGLAMVILIFVFIFYIYYAICLMFIAKKTNTAPAWLAWIPIGNLFLMCKIGKVSYWWILGYLLAVVPVIGQFLVLGINAYIFYKIAEARKKPGWLGILANVPLIAIITSPIIIGYLAFSE